MKLIIIPLLIISVLFSGGGIYTFWLSIWFCTKMRRKFTTGYGVYLQEHTVDDGPLYPAAAFSLFISCIFWILMFCLSNIIALIIEQ